MNTQNKRKTMDADKTSKRAKKECSYGENCYRRNPAHFREYSHPHLESILDAYNGEGDFPIPPRLSLQRHAIQEQLEIIVEKQLYEANRATTSTGLSNQVNEQSNSNESTNVVPETSTKVPGSHNLERGTNSSTSQTNVLGAQKREETMSKGSRSTNSRSEVPVSQKYEGDRPSGSRDSLSGNGDVLGSQKNVGGDMKVNSSGAAPKVFEKGSDYKPIVPPTRRPEDFLKVVRPRGRMAARHAARAPYYIFYTTITDEPRTHGQEYSITFLELLDPSLGELKCSLQINFMVEIGWLLAQYYFAGYSLKKLTILYGEECSDLKNITQKKPNVDAHMVQMTTPFGKHHTKMMILCYEDGSLRVVISTANLYIDDWENRTQGLWLSPSCPELPADAMPHDGESPTFFKRSLLRYLTNYHMPQLSFYVERVKRCDFSDINVFLVASVPGSHFDNDWALSRMGALLSQHAAAGDSGGRWPLIAQASSVGSYGKEAGLWLTGDFLHFMTKSKTPPKTLTAPPELKFIYPSLENVRQSHDNLLGGGCLPYGGELHAKQTWLTQYLYQWKAMSSHRNKAMPHIKSYTRISHDGKRSPYYLLTSANVSKAAWGVFNKGNKALRILSYEAGVLFLPKFLIDAEYFSIDPQDQDRLIIPYDLPPVKYTEDMSPWVQDYLR